MNKRSVRRLFFLVLLVAALLRTAGLFTYDFKRLPSEGDIRLNTGYMWARNTLQLREYAYPSLYFYMEFALEKLAYGFLRFFGTVRSPMDYLYSRKFLDVMYTTGRFLSVVLTLLIFLLLFRLAEREYEPMVGLVASIFLAFPLIDVINSRLAKPDSLLNFLLFLTVYFSVRFFREEKLRFLTVASMAAGFSISAKYFFISGFPVFFAVVLSRGRVPEKIKRLFWAGGVAILSFVLTCPYCILDYKKVLLTFSGAQNFSRGYIVPVHGAYRQVFPDLLRYTGYGVFFLFLIGLVVAFLKDWKINTIVFSFPAVYLLMLSVTKVYGPRYLVYLFPYISLYAAYALVRAVRKPAPALVFSLLLVIPMASQSLRAINWLVNRMANREIMADFIANSLPDPKMVVSYHAYWLPTTRYSMFPRYSKNMGKPLFFIYGTHEKYFCSPGSRLLSFCGPLLSSLPKYWTVLSLPSPPMPYAIDFSMSLMRKRPKPGPRREEFPALVKLPGTGKLLFPANPYVKDALVKRISSLGGVEKFYLYQGKGKVCLLVRGISKRVIYRVYFDGERKVLRDRIYLKCARPRRDFGRISVQSLEGFVEVFLSTSPLNIAQVLVEENPSRAEKFLLLLEKEAYYKFEARRLLFELYSNLGREREALAVRSRIIFEARRLKEMLGKNFPPKYRRAGYDLGYLKLSQRIYPVFKRGRKKSKLFYLFPGVYTLKKPLEGYLEMGEERIQLSGPVLVSRPGWARVVLEGEFIPKDFYISFSPEDTLRWEVEEILGGER